jgi:hypothetical protein
MHESKITIRRLPIVLTAAFVWYCLVCAVVAVAATITVPVGTAVTGVFNDPVDPAAASVGQTVMLSVVDPVVIEGAVVIQAGAPILAEVTVAQKRGAVGKPAKIGVALRYVTAVDGSNISLTGQKQIEGEDKQTESLVFTLLCCILGLLEQGAPATVPAGSQVRGTTMAPAAVVVPD